MTAIQPFQDETASLTLDEMTIENRYDRIALYGSLHITRDKEGLKRARELKAIIDATVARLQAEALPKKLPSTAPEKVSNPFDQ